MADGEPDGENDIGEKEIGETQILASLLGVAEMVCGLTDKDELLASIVRVIPVLVRVDLCAIMTYDEHAREFRTVTSFAPRTRRTPFDGLVLQEAEIPWLAQRLIALRLPALLKESTAEAGVPPALQQRLGMKSALVVPLAARGRFLGLLWLDDTRSAHYFTSKEINVVQGLAAQVAIALDGANLGEQLDLERRRLASLVGALADGLIVVDKNLRIVSIDAGAESLVGWQTSEVRGRRMHEVFEISEAEASVAWTMEKRGPASAPKDLRLRTRDGVPIDCTAQGVAIRGGEGDLVQVLYALRKKPGAKGYAERVTDSIERLAPVHAEEPPE